MTVDELIAALQALPPEQRALPAYVAVNEGWEQTELTIVLVLPKNENYGERVYLGWSLEPS